MPKPKGEEPVFATNRKARRDYDILETCEAGIALTGTEIKSIRRRHVSLDDSFARVDDGELFLYNMHVNPYEQGGLANAEPLRVRKLLLHRQQIQRLIGLLSQKRLTLIPLSLYQKHGLAKIELAVARGRRQYEKREKLRERETARELQRTVRRYRKTGS